MAIATTQILTLFDPTDDYQWFDDRFKNEICIRIIDSMRCLNHILCIQSKRPDLDVHLFFPAVQISNIYSRPQEYGNTIKYIYCRENSSINSIRQRYGRRFAHKIFTDDDLEFEINHVHITILHASMKQAPEDSTERKRLVLAAMGEIDMLQHNIRKMITDQLGQVPIERD